ncbi:MAG: CDP-alcohol phosphatidyltransferase [Porphyromonadaceae bacterium CG2_30_38_12]|nr:MAG: CDP-alcohol phosphatidyltransferase [Porphyromonadaceae bacterium CG2_30_38_12]
MQSKNSQKLNDTIKVIAAGRSRTNILKTGEQKTIAYLVQRLPKWLSSDMLTAIGFSGSLIILSAFILGRFIHPYWLLLGVFGFFVNWFGDSLDGRVAYYRHKQRKWYGFALDVTSDWVGISLIGIGFGLYVIGLWKIIGFVFVILYGWEMLTTMIRYKVTDQYSIDSGILGPTEVRIIISSFLIAEVLLPNSILVTGITACVILFFSNLVDTFKLLKLANERDDSERSAQRNA